MECIRLDIDLRDYISIYERCARHGSCCACLRYHLDSRELPACAFPAEVERTWDRSFERFIKTYR